LINEGRKHEGRRKEGKGGTRVQGGGLNWIGAAAEFVGKGRRGRYTVNNEEM
jgi:hypothetical protein